MSYSTLAKDWVVKYVPADIWRLAFRFSVSEDLQFCTFSPHRAPILLTHVCSTWREIVFSAPELWNRISLQADYYGTPAPHIDLFHHALFHARNYPLTLTIFETPADSGYIHDLSVVVPYLENVHRAKRLELKADIIRLFTDEHQAFQTAEAKWEGVKPLLEELVFYIGSQFFPSLPLINQAIANIWTPSPKLHTLIIGTDMMELQESMLFFPLDQLTTLDMYSSTTDAAEFLDILSKTKNLIRGKFSPIVGDLPSIQARGKPLFLSALLNLQLGGSWESYRSSPPLTGLLGHIVAPALISLSLLRDREWSGSAFTSFIFQSSCDIQHLTIDIDILRGEETVECMKLLQSLRSLSMKLRIRGKKINGVPKIFANAMSKWDDSKAEFSLFPKLETIDVDYLALSVPDAETFDTLFADMIETRLRRPPSHYPFKRITILDVYQGSPPKSHYSCELIRLLILKRDGLNIIFDPRPPPLQSVICR